MKGRRIISIAGYIIVLLILAAAVALLYGSRNKNESGKKQRTVGAVYMTMNNPYFEIINEEIRTVVEKEGDVLVTRDSAMDDEMQIQQVESFVEDKVDCIFVNAVDWKSISTALEKAKAAGIPVIALDTEIYDGSLVSGSIVSDNYQAGVVCAQDLMEKRKEGNILFMVQSENKSAIDRIQGFEDTLKAAGWGYETVAKIECQGQLEVAQPLVEEILQETKDIDVVMALNDPSAMGAMAALDAEGMLSDVLVYGVDGAPEAKTMISESRMTATAAQSPRTTGKKAAAMMYDILEGKETQTEIVLPVELITEKNVGDYSLTGWQ